MSSPNVQFLPRTRPRTIFLDEFPYTPITRDDFVRTTYLPATAAGHVEVKIIHMVTYEFTGPETEVPSMLAELPINMVNNGTNMETRGQ